ncbi:hypothetical protein B0H16DRAFT_1718442 [Mycena metata]|uniref:Uncharacterized protein n=1 Tax=Mycena metata TaxID=1033252 RepID=A0AAD7JI13_9AGAR|nr:hypothetical protein B0H16DRAFT_1718442 [Mycena metata]
MHFHILHYPQYVLLVDVDKRRHRIAPHFEPTTFYGELQNIFVVKLPPTPELQLPKETTLILAAVRVCTVTVKNDLDMHYYQKDGSVEVVDISSIQCLVGRLRTTDKKSWVLIDRRGKPCPPVLQPR